MNIVSTGQRNDAENCTGAEKKESGGERHDPSTQKHTVPCEHDGCEPDPSQDEGMFLFWPSKFITFLRF